jgi:hypothetical protein
MLTEITEVFRVAHTPRNRIFYAAPPMPRTVPSTVFHSTIFGDERRSALALTKAIAHTIFNSYKNYQIFFSVHKYLHERRWRTSERKMEDS